MKTNQVIRMKSYTHLSRFEREDIMIGLSKGNSLSEIARNTNRNKSTISREIKRNSRKTDYSATLAQDKYHQRRTNSHKKLKLSNFTLYSIVQDKFLTHRWSPEQISGWMEADDCPHSVGTSTIYRGIYAGDFDLPGKKPNQKGSERFLRHKGKPRHEKDSVEKRGKIQISHELDERPVEAETRSRLGDWEADTVIGKIGKACLMTLVDRKSRFLLC